jgi:hypothetical protein
MFDPSLLRGEEVIVVQTKRTRLGGGGGNRTRAQFR